MLRCFHKPTTSLFFSLLVFQQLRSILLFKEALSNSIVIEVVVLFSVLLIPLFHLSRRHCDVFFDPSSHFGDHVLFLAYPFNRSVVFSFELSHLIKFCLLPQPECGLKSFLPLVPFFNSFEGSVLLISSSIIPSSQVHVNSFHFQSECCPNYIILNPTLSCFNWSGFKIYLVP